MKNNKEVQVFDKIKITENTFIFPGHEGYVAYVGTDGVSVTIEDFDDYIPLKWDEFEIIDDRKE